MRSIAHEMTHMMQDQQNMLHGNIRDAGGFHEDQANAKAGELIKLYAKQPGRKKYTKVYLKRLFRQVNLLHNNFNIWATCLILPSNQWKNI